MPKTTRKSPKNDAQKNRAELAKYIRWDLVFSLLDYY